MADQEQCVGREDRPSARQGPTATQVASSATPAMTVPNKSLLKYLVRRPKVIKALLKGQQRQTQQIMAALQRQGQGFRQCVDVAAGCQEQTARLLQHDLERHALEPAVRAVVVLAEELFRLDHLARKLCQGHGVNGELQTVAHELHISVGLAHDKLAFLDIERIEPAPVDKLDPHRHSICDHADTTDQSLHGRIRGVITPGVFYRGKVLRQARVSVFRYTDGQSKNQEEQERNAQ